MTDQPPLVPGMDWKFGLGDVLYEGFLSPANPGKVIWGVGPAISFPTATDELLGSEKWSAGPAAVVLIMPGRWVLGVLALNTWSYAGQEEREHVNMTTIQPFVNYNFPKGWYAASVPLITANWKAPSDDTWTLPVGGGFGRTFRIGKQAMNASMMGFYNVEQPGFGPEWSIRVTYQVLFPKKKK